VKDFEPTDYIDRKQARRMDRFAHLVVGAARQAEADSGLEIEPLGLDWPQYAHPKRPEFLLTRPDRDNTSGFFIARLTS